MADTFYDQFLNVRDRRRWIEDRVRAISEEKETLLREYGTIINEESVLRGKLTREELDRLGLK